MSETPHGFERLVFYPEKRRQIEHRALAISKLLTSYNGPVSIYQIFKDLTEETYYLQLRSIEKKVRVTLGIHGYPQVLRLVKQMEARGFVSLARDKRNALLTELTFKGLLFGLLSGYISSEESMRYVTRKIPFVNIFTKLWPRAEPPGKEVERTWALVEMLVAPYLLPEALQMKGEEPPPSQYLVLTEKEYFLVIELGMFRSLLLLMRKGEVTLDDLKKLSRKEREVLKKTWNMYLHNARDWYDLYKFADHKYDEEIRSL